jgi:hypothetical protein
MCQSSKSPHDGYDRCTKCIEEERVERVKEDERRRRRVEEERVKTIKIVERREKQKLKPCKRSGLCTNKCGNLVIGGFICKKCTKKLVKRKNVKNDSFGEI